MVRRRDIYQIEIIGKPLKCLFCDNTTFSHRQVYMKVVGYDANEPKRKLTFQSLTCVKCGQKQMFEERTIDGIHNIHYIEVQANG